MNRTTTNILLMLITIIAGIYFYITYCSECGTTNTKDTIQEEISNTEIETPKATSFPFSINNGEFLFSSADNYNFNLSSFAPILPLSDSLNQGINSLSSYLKDNQNQVLDITGYYLNSEENTSAFPNLGLARANSIKLDLASKGISTSQINTSGQEMVEMTPDGNILMGAAKFSLTEKSADAENEILTLYTKIKENPLVLYFNTAEASINLSSEQRQKVAEINRYVDKVDGAIIEVIGHTDNTGKATTNMKLGLDRANFAKDYLISNGISETNIAVSSKGETQPIESNATEEGRNKNRRTVITLK